MYFNIFDKVEAVVAEIEDEENENENNEVTYFPVFDETTTGWNIFFIYSVRTILYQGSKGIRQWLIN